MTQQTAAHYNELRKAAVSCFIEKRSPDFDTIVVLRHAPGKLVSALNDILEKHSSAAQAEEIRRAASEGRECAVTHGLLGWYSAGTYTLRETGYTRVLWGIAEPAIRAEVAAYNARTQAEFEAYRTACEQGVAVPPKAERE